MAFIQQLINTPSPGALSGVLYMASLFIFSPAPSYLKRKGVEDGDDKKTVFKKRGDACRGGATDAERFAGV